MKLLLLLLALCLISAPAVATALTFQPSSDYASVVCNITVGGSCNFVGSTIAGNQYVLMQADACAGGCYKAAVIKNKLAFPMTYAGATISTTTPSASGGLRVALFDSNNNTMYGFDTTSTAPTRVEVSVVGSTAYLYKNGILVGNSTPLSQNPSHIGFGACNGHAFSATTVGIDDIVYGTTDPKYVVGMPAQNGYYLKKDMVNPANSGVFNYSTGALVNSNYMYTTWGKSNVSAVGGDNINESMYLQHVDTGVTYETNYTGNATAGTATWNIASSLVATSAPYGMYRVRFGDFDSDQIAYIANGANVNFDKDDYNQNDVATITYLIDAPYWDTSTYTYALKVYRVNDWVVVSNTPIVSTTGTVLYSFTSSDTQGTYYGVVTATPNVGGDEIWMAFDYAQMTAYFAPYGYVNNETGSVIVGANVSLSQGSIISNTITDATGNYTGSGFLTGAVMTFNVTATGYSQYLATLSPMVTGSKYINITLNSTTPAYTGLGIGGIHRDGILTGTLITSGYGRPIAGATAHLINSTYGESCTNVSNMAGWYLFDEGASCFLTTGRLYDIWSEKLGYSNSPNYTAVAA